MGRSNRKSKCCDKVKISGAYVTEFGGELQLNIPKKEKRRDY
jgi:hypothetical protein